MCSQVCYTSDSVALNLDIVAQHLPDEGLKSAQFHNEQLVLGYSTLRDSHLENERRRTVDSQVAQSSTCSTLNFCVMAAQEKQDRVQSISPHLSDFFLRDLSECESSTPLQIDVVREREDSQSSEWLASEKVGS